MITCRQCIDEFKPDDPRIKSGSYHLSGCDYCNKPLYFRNIEDGDLPDRTIVDLDKESKDEMKRLRAQVMYLDKQVRGLYIKKRSEFYE